MGLTVLGWIEVWGLPIAGNPMEYEMETGAIQRVLGLNVPE